MAWRMDPRLESPFEALLVESQKNQFGAAGQMGLVQNPLATYLI